MHVDFSLHGFFCIYSGWDEGSIVDHAFRWKHIGLGDLILDEDLKSTETDVRGSESRCHKDQSLQRCRIVPQLAGALDSDNLIGCMFYVIIGTV